MALLPCARMWRSSYFIQAQTPRRFDGIHAIEVLGRLIGRVTRRNLYAGIVERHVQAAEVRSSVVVRSASALMSASTMAAPASAKALAVASPTTELAPVTRATWPLMS